MSGDEEDSFTLRHTNGETLSNLDPGSQTLNLENFSQSSATCTHSLRTINRRNCRRIPCRTYRLLEW